MLERNIQDLDVLLDVFDVFSQSFNIVISREVQFG